MSDINEARINEAWHSGVAYGFFVAAILVGVDLYYGVTDWIVPFNLIVLGGMQMWAWLSARHKRRYLSSQKTSRFVTWLDRKRHPWKTPGWVNLYSEGSDGAPS